MLIMHYSILADNEMYGTKSKHYQTHSIWYTYFTGCCAWVFNHYYFYLKKLETDHIVYVRWNSKLSKSKNCPWRVVKHMDEGWSTQGAKLGKTIDQPCEIIENCFYMHLGAESGGSPRLFCGTSNFWTLILSAAEHEIDPFIWCHCSRFTFR